MVSPRQSKAITVRSTPPLPPRTLVEQKLKQERLHDVELLLQDMFIREETTVKLIFDSLYDIGAINIINKKIPFLPLNRFLKVVVKFPKPIAKIFLFRWFVANCPKLLTDWLHSKVRFK
ncbi:MAG: hypothetical protein RLZZ568_1520 [Cyanobacteriota bacterium]